ncbi:MAG: hypothetical protein H6797_05365 [Candidatus Nomurabacteria bacterium]|nr:MAG: hypothetical protein H6797_05365 [Candidatus Nomurabacteria bacterium]
MLEFTALGWETGSIEMKARWTTPQLIWAILLVVAGMIAALSSVPKLLDALPQSSQLCTTAGLLGFIGSILQPRYYLTILFLLITVTLIHRATKLLSSKSAAFAPYPALVVALAVTVLLSISAFRCG